MNRRNLSQMMLCFLVDLLPFLPPYTVSNHNSDGGAWNSLPVPNLVKRCPFIPGCHSDWQDGELLPALAVAESRDVCSSGLWFICLAFLALCAGRTARSTESRGSSFHPELLLPEPLRKAKGKTERGSSTASFTPSTLIASLERQLKRIAHHLYQLT